MLKLNQYYKYICNKLKSIYSEKEAQAIARYYICEIINLNNIDFFIKSQTILNNEELKLLKFNEKRLLNMEPVQYITGYAYFSDYKFKVNPDVLIPRQETEILVNKVIENHKYHKNLNIVDIGTGSGCIAVSIAKKLPNNCLFAIDISKNALLTAKKNAKLNDVTVNFKYYDIFSENAFPFKPKFDIIISNPPYVTENEKKDIKKNVLDFEPHKSLFVSDSNPLIYYNRIFQLSKKIGSEKVILYLEINEKFGKETYSLAKQYGFNHIEIIKDLSNKDRVIVASNKVNDN